MVHVGNPDWPHCTVCSTKDKRVHVERCLVFRGAQQNEMIVRCHGAEEWHTLVGFDSVGELAVFRR